MPILELWVPIAAVTAATFFLSFLMWAALQYHRADVAYCPQQDEVIDLVNSSGIKPGRYMFPNCADHAEFKNPDKMAMYNKGPWGVIDIWAGKPSMGRNMALTLGYFVLVSVLVAYLTGLARPAGSSFMEVFQVATTAAFLAHVLGGIPEGIWFGKRTRFFLTDAIDGVIYALATGVVFALLWPAAEVASVATP
ncbi:MAG: hypothetical protein COB69_04125 [Phycisphaera sp.]|nr:MAG: hypothetical protein COB69_04125 [Phycisphaera sp.]